MLKLTMLAAIVLVATAAHAEQTTRNFYDAHGNFAGTARTHGPTSAVALSVALSTVATASRCTTGTATSPAVSCGNRRSGSLPRPARANPLGRGHSRLPRGFT